MHLKPIRTEAEHAEAVADIEGLWDAPEGSSEADHLEVLTMLVEAYEKEHHGIDMPDPVSFLEYVMEARGLTRKDLEPCIGPRGRVADILTRTRPLSMGMIRRLVDGLGLPATTFPFPSSLGSCIVDAEVAAEGEECHCCGDAVRDNGPGFSQEAIVRSQEGFFSSKREGLGLGLMISRQIAQMHQGDLQICNAAEGGACVTLQLPIAS